VGLAIFSCKPDLISLTNHICQDKENLANIIKEYCSWTIPSFFISSTWKFCFRFWGL